MEVEKIHSYLVRPEKHESIQTLVKGTEIAMQGKLYPILRKIFLKAPNECNSDIIFLPNEAEEPKNECRDLAIQFAKTKQYYDGLKLAERLQKLTTLRSGLGLLFLMVGRNGKNTRLVISRFPAGEGILANDTENSLTVEFVEKIFMRNARTYKSVCFEGASFDSEFWKGKAIDKQINDHDLTISNYWIKEFLLSDFVSTGERGTKRFAAAMRNAINRSPSLDIKQELAASVILAKGFDSQVVSASGFVNRLKLSSEAKETLQKEFRHSSFDEQFIFVADEFNKLIPVKTIELDNGAILSAPTEKFDSVFKRNQSINGQGEITFYTTGKIVDERVKKIK